MHRRIMRVVAAAGAALSTVGISVASVSCGGTTTSTATTAPQPSHPSAAPGAQLWVQRYNGPGNGDDGGLSGAWFQPVTAVSPSGATVFVTGGSKGAGSGSDYATVAYNAATGARLWVSRYNGPGNSRDEATSVKVSPSGRTVFVSGTSTQGTGSHWATVAYNAATGARLWASLYNGSGIQSVAVSPDGARVFVTGTAIEPDYATVAYNAATGAQLWASLYNGPANREDEAKSVAVSPDGSRVFVTGNSNPANSKEDCATVAYNAATGTRLWASRYNGPANKIDVGTSVAVNPRGDRVFVTGMSERAGSGSDYATLAYKEATGALLWVSRYHGAANGGTAGGFFDNAAFSVAVSPGGGAVFVTGTSSGAGSDFATVAYNAATGTRLWASRYNGPGNGDDFATSVVVNRAGTVFVTGASKGAGSGFDYATVAYRG